MSKYKCIRKGLLSAVAVMAAAVMLGGCGNEAAEKAVPDNYEPEELMANSIRTEKRIKNRPQNDIDRSYRNVVTFKDGLTGTFSGENTYGVYESSTGFIVQYRFTNNSDSSQNMLGFVGELCGYQNGIELSYEVYGDYNELTDVLPGATVELMKVFETDNLDDPVELLSTYAGYWEDITTYHSIMTPITEICYSEEDVPYSFEIKGAGFTDSGKIVVDSTFTNTSDSPVTPASVYAVLAYQGTKQLSVSSESQDNEGYLLKWFKAEPNETVSLSTTFVLDNSSDSVIVYLTDPETGDVFSEKIYSR